MQNRAFVVVVALLGCAVIPAKMAGQSSKAAQVFKANGDSAFANLPGATVNGFGVRTTVQVSRDSAGNTSLLLRVFDGVPPNRTTYFLSGPIPSTDFVLASDLSSATLNTTINTSPGHFDNADIGSVAGLVISLTWSSDLFGSLVDTSVQTEKSGTSPPQSFRETFHQNGPHADGSVSGMFGSFVVAGAGGSLDRNRTIDVVQEK